MNNPNTPDGSFRAVKETLQRQRFLPFSQPDFDESELREIKAAIDSGWVTSGPKTSQFESEFATAVGAWHAISVNSCTAAMHLSLDAIGLRSGDEVITTPYTFAATAEVVRYFGAKPVFVDVDPTTLNIDTNIIGSAFSHRTKVILPIHIAGLPVELNSISELARQKKVAVIEDAAHAFPSKFNGQMIGGLSDFTCFSFYATKSITTGEGGMICTNDVQWADRCRIMSLHGISKDAWDRYTAHGSWYYEIVASGFKYNMTDIAAAMGLAQLRKSEEMWKRRRSIAQSYTSAFSQLPEVQVPFDNPDHQHAWHLYMLRLNLDMLAIDRGRFFEELKARNIGASVHFIPLHIHPYYRDLYGYRPEDFPVAYREYLREISLPIYSKMTDEDVSDVINAVADIVRTFRR